MTTLLIDKALIEQAIDALANVEVSGPDDDGVIWINLPGNGVTGKAILRVGKGGLIAAQCATLFDEQRVGAIAALRAALAEPAPVPLLTDAEVANIRKRNQAHNLFARAIEKAVRQKAGL